MRIKGCVLVINATLLCNNSIAQNEACQIVILYKTTKIPRTFNDWNMYLKKVTLFKMPSYIIYKTVKH